MTDNITKIWGVSLSILAFSLAVSTASAQTCGEQPTCESLGYVYGSSDCKNVPTLTCPFDSYYKYCASPSCPDGYFNIDASSWSTNLGIYTGSRGTSCSTLSDLFVSSIYSEVKSKCPIDSTRPGTTIFDTAATQQGTGTYQGAGQYTVEESSPYMIVMGGPHISINNTDNSSFMQTATGMGYTVVDVGPSAALCPSSNSSVQDKLLEFNLNGGATNYSATDKTLGYGQYIIIAIKDRRVISVLAGEGGKLPEGSSLGNPISSGTKM